MFSKKEYEHCYYDGRKITNKMYLEYVWDKITDNTLFQIVALFIIVILFLSFLFLVLSIILYPFMMRDCINTGRIMNLPYQYDFWAGCFLKYNNIWVKASQIVQLLNFAK